MFLTLNECDMAFLKTCSVLLRVHKKIDITYMSAQTSSWVSVRIGECLSDTRGHSLTLCR